MTHYFSPGPSALPQEVKNIVHEQLLDTFGIGVSVMEISHRSSQYEQLNAQTLELAREVFQVPNTHEVLFCAVGAQQHFSLFISHLSAPGDDIAYTDTGIWSHLACEEAAQSNRKVHVVYNGAPDYKSLGDTQSWSLPAQARFVHLTVNNTVYGTEYSKIPTFGSLPLVLDMTSSLGARTDIPWSNTAIVYASAQKNFGIAGVSVVIIKKEALEKSRQFTKLSYLGRALTYGAIFDAKSALNTPPVMPIFVMNKMLSWMKKEGGVAEMEARARQKSRLIYDQLDGDYFVGNARPQDRSRHNFVFRLRNTEQDLNFVKEAAKQDILEIKGYKTIGGIRVSMYNGISLESAKIMAEFMEHYRQKRG